MAGHSAPTLGRIKCCSWRITAIAALLMTDAAMAGRASPWDGNEMDTYADDLATVVEKLELRTRSRRSLDRRRRSGPLYRPTWDEACRQSRPDKRGSAAHAKDTANPGGLPMEVFDRSALASWPTARSSSRISAPLFYGANRPGAKVSQGMLDSFWHQCMQTGIKGVYDCIKAFSETDFTEDLKQFDVPTLRPSWRR